MPHSRTSHWLISALASATIVPATALAQEMPVVQIETNPTAQPAPIAYVYVDAAGNVLGPAPAPALPPRAPEVRTPVHATLGASVSYVLFEDSSFRQASHAWGYGGFTDGMVVAFDGGVHVNRYLLVGARLGYTNSGGGHSQFDSAPMTLDLWDVDLQLRLGYPVRLRNDWVFFPGVQVQAGAANASIHLRGETNNAWMPRASGEAMVMFMSRYVGVSARVGYQYARWNATDGTDLSLSLAGLTLGLGLEVRL